ncbi:MAG: cytochrome c oxidase subunit 4 [Actinomycetes bacterium]
MKVEGYLFAGVAIFFAIVTPVYWYTSEDPTGTTALTLSFGLAFLVGYYLLFTSRRIEPRPEDRPDAEIADGAGTYGFYSPHSWWPLIMAASAATATLGIVFGWWLCILGAVFTICGVVGFVMEYYHGDKAEQAHPH